MPARQQREALRDHVAVGLDRREEEEGILVPDEGVEDPVVLDLEHLEE